VLKADTANTHRLGSRVSTEQGKPTLIYDCSADLPLDALKARFLDLRDKPLPKFTRRGLMTRAVEHAIREATFGGLDRETQKRLDQLVRQIVPSGEKPPPAPRMIKAGTRLLREWQGRVHEVTVTKDGFVWQGAAHRSLSEIARLITGTRWNGWVFFGLKKTGSAPSQATNQRRGRRRSRGQPQSTAAATSGVGEGVRG
jgi:hypothetical protein